MAEPEWGTGEEALQRDRPPEPGGWRVLERRSFRSEDSSAFAWPEARSWAPEPDRAFAVVPCLNEAEHIVGLIRHLLDDPDWRDPLVVVADGGSTDGTIEI